MQNSIVIFCIGEGGGLQQPHAVVNVGLEAIGKSESPSDDVIISANRGKQGRRNAGAGRGASPSL